MSLSKPSQIDAVDASGSGPSIQPLHFMKLNVDCWEKVFDYLSLSDILQMSQTCKRMQQIGGYYYRNNFPKMIARYDVEKGLSINGNPVRKDFLQLVDSLAISEESDHVLMTKHCCSVKNLWLHGLNLDETQFANIKDLLCNVENLNLLQCSISGDFYEGILKHCPKLKCLAFAKNNWQPESGENWLHQEYPMLQRLEVESQDISDSSAITTFLENNPNLKCLEINAKDLWAIRDSIVKTNVRLDYLVVYIIDFDSIQSIAPMTFFNLLNSLYDQGFYKSLEVDVTRSAVEVQELPNGMATLNALKKVLLFKSIDVSGCSELTELGIFDQIVMDMRQMATKLTKLKRIEFAIASTDDILPFFQYSSKLITVAVWELTGGSLLMDDVLNLFALNREREKIERAHRIWVHVDDNIYLATKWKMGHLDLKLIDLKRFDSYDF